MRYTWYNASRLTGITQGSSTVGFVYDNANRRTTLALPNGVTVAYTYDRFAGDALTYASNVNPLGNLTIRIRCGGPRGRQGRESGGNGAARGGEWQYVQRRQRDDRVQWHDAELRHQRQPDRRWDQHYVWDTRNHMSAISGGTTASFVYDAVGRRAAKNINGTVTQFLYDGSSRCRSWTERGPADVTANLLTGLGVDEYFTRIDSSGAMVFTADALGSTVGLVNPAGSISLRATTTSRLATWPRAVKSNANTYQFAGRENDGTGLYFYGARYSPTFQRFVSQDPIDFRGGGPNLFSYVFNDPINAIDPLGLKITSCKKGDCPPTPPHWKSFVDARQRRGPVGQGV